MKALALLVLIAVSGMVNSETLTVKYCPSEADTPNSIKAKLSRKASDELESIGWQTKNSQLELHEDKVMVVDSRVLGSPPIIKSIEYGLDGECHLGLYTY